MLAYYVHLVAWLGGPAAIAAIGADYSADVDPRIGLVEAARAQKGAVTSWASLGGRWAVPKDTPWQEAGPGYGAGIARHLAAILALPTAATVSKIGVPAVAVPKPPLTIDHTPTKLGGYTRGTRRQLMICSHITGGTDSLSWLRDPHPDGKGGDDSPSVNYLIRRDGTIIEIVDPHGPAAWANGINYADFPQGKKPNRANPLIAQLTDQQISPNQWTISIEHEGASGGAMTPAQWASTLALQAWLCQEFGITPDPIHIIGHFEIDGIDRPYCPGWTGDQWDHLQAQIAATLAGGTLAPISDAIAKGVVAPADSPGAPTASPVSTPVTLPEGFLPLGAADTFDWEGAGVIVYRKVRYFNPTEDRYYEREWSNDGGYTAWLPL